MQKNSASQGTKEEQNTRFSLKDWGFTIGKNTIIGGASGAVCTLLLSGTDMGLATAASTALGFLTGVVDYPASHMLKKRKAKRRKMSVITNTCVFLFSLVSGIMVAACALLITNYIAATIGGFDVIDHLRSIDPIALSTSDRSMKLLFSLLGSVLGIVTASFVRKVLSD